MKNPIAKTGKKINYRILVKRVLFLVLFIYLASILVSQQFQFSELNRERAEVEAQIEAAQKEQSNLNSELESVDSEDYLRRVIREKLGYTRPDEKVFVDASK